MKELPKPKHKYGYPLSQVKEIMKELGISYAKFSKAFGVNTYSVSETGEIVIYPCDIENALYKLGCKLGKFHLWD